MNEGRASRGGNEGTPASALCFGAFKLDPRNEQLWRGKSRVELQPKTFAVLRYLAERPQRLVTKQELLDALWADVVVGDAVLKTHLREIRAALRDDVKSPRFIETAHRRGYRFIAAVERVAPPSVADPAGAATASTGTTGTAGRSERPGLDSGFVGRESELSRLNAALGRALDGPLQVVFVTGEAGAGKTTLANAFIRRLEQRGDLWLARGQCIEQYGAGEAYLPVLEALGRLCRQSGGERITEVLRAQAPTWLMQMPAVIEAAELTAIGRTAAATPERMLREMAEAILAISLQRPLVLVFEDLHWADYSTLHLISYLARRADSARVLILGTHRPRDAVASDHPLEAIQQDLLGSARCEVLSLADLDEVAVGQYFTARFPGSVFPQGLPGLTRERTNGNPLFLVRLVDSWVEQQWIAQRHDRWELAVDVHQLARAVPPSVSRMIEKQLEKLSDFERDVVEAASVAGVEFSVLAAAAALEEDVVRVESVCAGCARRGHFFRLAGRSDWPDGAVSLHCAFLHGLYQQVAYDQIGAARLAQLHRRLGNRLEAAYADRAVTIAGELAMHFERGTDHARAIRYSLTAGEQALGNAAFREATAHFQRGLNLLEKVARNGSDSQLELDLRLALGTALAMTRGYASPEVLAMYDRAGVLCERLGEARRLLPQLTGLFSSYIVQGAHLAAHAVGAGLSDRFGHRRDPHLDLAANYMLGSSSLYLARLSDARVCLERALALYASGIEPRADFQQDPGVISRADLSLTLWLLGYADQAAHHSKEMLADAERAGHPFGIVFARHFLAVLSYWLRDLEAMSTHAEVASALCTAHGFDFFLPGATIFRGRALVARGGAKDGIDLIQTGCDANRSNGAQIGETQWYAMLAEACIEVGDLEQADLALQHAAAAVQRNHESYCEAELYRLRGAVLVEAAHRGSDASSGSTDAPLAAEQCFQTALDVARRHEAKSLELRAAMSLAGLWERTDKRNEARALLADVYGWFREGLQTTDLEQARLLIARLAAEGPN